MSDGILQLAQQHLKRAKPAGPAELKAVCPFHRKADGREEQNPSFYINRHSGLWFCQSCHAAGNLYGFLHNIGLSRTDIVLRYKDLLEEAEQYAPPPPDPLNPIEATAEPLEESILGLFDYCPQLLLDEGYPEDLLRRFDVGFDETHMRITFPLRDSRGKLIGISGRSINGKNPRYKVYDWEYKDFGLPERKTEKRVLVWNVHNVLIQLGFEKDPCARFVIVTEGFKSSMRVAQAGVGNVVGLLGSHMSEEQLWLLGRLGCPLMLMFDNNDAGRRGQLDAALRLVNVVPTLRVLEYIADQPSDLLVEEITQSIHSAKPVYNWLQAQTY